MSLFDDNGDFVAEYISIERKEPGTYVNGRWVEGMLQTIPLRAVVLPLNATELSSQIALSGLEDRHGIAIYTEEEIFEANEETKQNRDVISWRGRNYTVASVSYRYQLENLKHYKTIAYLENS